MKVAAPHPQEERRIETLESYDILDSELDARFQLLVEQASAIAGVPIGLVSLVDSERQWFMAKVGIDATETPREVAFCAHAILGDDIFEIPDAREDERFRDNPLVTGGPRVTFYAGVPLHAKNKLPLGTLCVIDDRPRRLDESQRTALRTLARQAEVLLEARQRARLRRTRPTQRSAGTPSAEAASPSRQTADDDARRVANVVSTDAWAGLAERTASALEDFMQMDVEAAPRSAGAGPDGPAVSIGLLERTNDVQITIDLVTTAASLGNVARTLMGESDPETDRAVLLETANILMGALKAALEAEGRRLTAGLPRARSSDDAVSAPVPRLERRVHSFVIGDGIFDVRFALGRPARAAVPVNEACEGMVVASSVRDPAGGETIVHEGTRLTETSIAHLRERAPSAILQIAATHLR
jgi:GAF domain-containing protein